MRKIISLTILRGIPGSGKTTYSKQMCNDFPDTYVRVCRDDIRSQLGKYWVPKRELLVTDIENDSVESALVRGYCVLLDATNLNDREYDRWYKMKNRILQLGLYSDVQIIYLDFDVSLYKAIWRDFWRRFQFGKRSVGIKVIKQFYKKYCNAKN